MSASLICMLCLVFPARSVFLQAGDDADAEQLDRQLLEAHNRERAEAKLPPLTLAPRLTRAARRHARDMAQHEKMSHEGSDGSQTVDRIKGAGYHYVRIGENVAEGQKSVDKVLKAWMDSPGHKANILGDFTQMGGGRAVDESGGAYWCVDFGVPVVRLKPAEAAAGLVERLNAVRGEAKLEPLQLDGNLAEAARRTAQAVADADARRSQKDEPSEPSKRPDVVKLVQEAGVSFSGLSQYIATGAPTVENVIESMLKNDGEKRMVLGDFRFVGVGYVSDAEDRPYWCVLLVEP